MTDDCGFLERCGRLIGQTTFRHPIEGTGTRVCHIPESNLLASALSFARGPKWQPGPELIYAKATGVENKRGDVVEWLAGKLGSKLGAVGELHKGRIEGIAFLAYCLVVRGNDSVQGIRIDAHAMKLADVGASWLSACLDETLERAERRPVSIPEPVAETA